MRERGSRGLWAAAALAGAMVALLVPATAVAAPAKPTVTTGGVANVGPTSAVTNGIVDPNQAATTYFFQYGTTSLYGAQTPPASAGSGRKGVRVAATLSGLAPATRYHYRLVAQNAKGLTKGKDRVFTTRRQPLGVTLAAAPNPIRAGRSTTLAGTLTGTGNASRQVALQANPFPYTQGFVTLGNTQVTDAAGAFAFPLLSVGVNTQYRVLMPQKPEVVSPIVVVGTAVRVTTRVKRGTRLVRFSGRIAPAAPGSKVLIQRRRRGHWVTVTRTFARDSSARFSRYVKRFRLRRSGRYRVFADVQGAHVGDTGRTVRLRR